MALASVLISVAAFGQVVVSGHVFEQDGLTPIEAAEIVFSGYSLDGDTIMSTFSSDSVGFYEAAVEEGTYAVSVSKAGYQSVSYADSVLVMEGQLSFSLDFILYEIYHPVSYVAARPFNDDMVRISWSMNEPLLYEDFESGD